jgi:Putative transposase/Transposase zinc-binding domain
VVSLAEILRRHWPAYRAKFGSALPPAHRAAVKAILSCRTSQRGGHLFVCDCGGFQFAYHSCGHRACNQCGRADAQTWARRQETKLLPVPYFLVTFTVPEELRAVIRAQAKELYGALFRESAGTLADVALTKLGIEVGFTGVLHTWTRQLLYHPHIHYLVPGGGLTPDGLRWKRVTDPQFFLPTGVLAARFKNRLRQWLEAQHQDWLKAIPARAWRAQWVVDVQPVGRGQTALRYLAAYVQKTALSAARLVACDEATVTFTHQDRATGQTRTLRLNGQEFLRRFLQHVLPTGFQRVRHFGWLSPAATVRWQRIQALLDWKPAQPPTAHTAPCWVPECPRCHKPMRLLGPLARCPPRHR